LGITAQHLTRVFSVVYAEKGVLNGHCHLFIHYLLIGVNLEQVESAGLCANTQIR
jgi:hypothetical protein